MTLKSLRSRSQDFLIKYLEYEDRQNVGVKSGQIGNHLWTFNWHYVLKILDNLELAYFKVIKTARQILRKW